MDFTTIEVLDPTTNTLATYYVLFAMRLATREVSLVGVTQHPMEARMLQRARNVTDDFDLREHIAYYNHERNHQGVSGHPIPIPVHDRDLNLSHPVKCHSRLEKRLNFYYRQAV